MYGVRFIASVISSFVICRSSAICRLSSVVCRPSCVKRLPPMGPISEPLRLRTLLATYPHTAPLKNGDVASARVALDFKDVTPVWSGFKAMVRRQEFDVSEMAVVTYLIAKSFGKPMVLLPAVMTGRIQHAWAIYNGERGALTPADLKGRRVGIRSFTTTTGAWLRGMFENDYGLDLASVRWITFEEPHVAEYVDA